MKKPNWTKAADILSEQIYKDLTLMNSTNMRKHTQGRLHLTDPINYNDATGPKVGQQLVTDGGYAAMLFTHDGSAEGMANADRIAHCWNCHDELVAALKETSQVLGWAFNQGADPEPVASALTNARAALSRAQRKARGE